MEIYTSIAVFLVLYAGKVSSQQQQQPGLVNLLTSVLIDNGEASGLSQQPGIADLVSTLFANSGTQSGQQQTSQQQGGITNLLTAFLSNNEAALTLLETSGLTTDLEELLDYLNTTGNITGVINTLSTDQIFSLTTSLVTLLFESLTLTVLTNNRVTDACQTDMIILIEELVRGNPWALRMFDAIGKPGSDLADLQAKFVGSYEECVAIHAVSYTTDNAGNQRERGSFNGKYCSVSISVPGVPEIISDNENGVGFVLLGLCLPDSCGNTDAQTFASLVERVMFNRTVPFLPTARCQNEHKDVGTDAIIVIGILSLLGCLIICGTVYDVVAIQMKTQTDMSVERKRVRISKSVLAQTIVTSDSNADLRGVEIQTNRCTNYAADESEFEQQKSKSTEIGGQRSLMERILLSFSVYTNGSRILTTKQNGQFASLNGIRVLGISWIVLGHTGYYAFRYTGNVFGYAFIKIDDWSFLPIVYSEVSVDTFFVMSGLLVSHLTLKQMKSVGGPRKINWFMFYFHRYLRITPAVMFVMMVGTVILPYISYGPFWNSDNFPNMAECRQNWWANLFYINNYYEAKDQSCMSWTWYIANDMQFYWISPLIILPLFYQMGTGIAMCVLLILANIVVVGKIAYNDNYSTQKTAFLYGNDSSDDKKYLKTLYFPSYARCGPYVVGILTGYILYRLNCKCKIPRALNLIGWFLSVAVTSLIVYSRFEDEGNHIFSRMESAIFIALFRIGWALAVSWMIFACITENGGLVNCLLSWKGFVPLARLSLCAYLLNPIVTYLFYTSRMLPLHMSDYELIFLFLGHLVMTFGLAFVLSLMIEAPVISLEKVLLAK